MRSGSVAAVSAVAVALVGAFFPAGSVARDGVGLGSSGGSVAVCEFTADFTLSPGVTSVPSTFRFTTNGETATVRCQGEVNGSRVTGAGTYGENGVIYGGNCYRGSGKGSYSAHIPTEAGVQYVTGKFDLQYVGLTGSESGPGITATFEYFPTEGDCFNEPLTAFTLVQQEELRTG